MSQQQSTEEIYYSAVRDVRDLVIEHVAYDRVLADERIAALEADVAVVQEVLGASLDALRDLTVSYDTLRVSHARVCDDYQRFREDVLLAGGADL